MSSLFLTDNDHEDFSTIFIRINSICDCFFFFFFFLNEWIHRFVSRQRRRLRPCVHIFLEHLFVFFSCSQWGVWQRVATLRKKSPAPSVFFQYTVTLCLGRVLASEPAHTSPWQPRKLRRSLFQLCLLVLINFTWPKVSQEDKPICWSGSAGH